jgi:cullin-associated NEDD8-dissociated protein 1
MATSDLCVQLQRHTNLTLDPTLERRICSTILSLLNDDSNDVQAIAVKTLGVLLTVVQQDQVVEIAQRLQSLLLDQDKADLRDVYTIGLRTLIKTIPPTMGNAVCERLYYHTISGIDNISDENIVLALIDVLTELLTRFGGLLVMHHEAILQALMARLKGSANNVVKRRASDALGCTSVVLSDLLLTRLVDMLLQQIQQQEQQATTGTGTNDSRAYIRTMCVISGSVGHRLAQRIDAILPMFLRLCPPSAAAATYNDDGGDDFDQEHQFDDNYDLQERDQDQKQLVLTNELRESCFAGFESFITRCPLEIMPYLPQLINACLAYMCYDPNYTYDLDQEDAGDAMANDEGNYEEEDEEFSDEDDFSDDDDESWKLRRAAIRCLVAIVDAMKGDPTKLWTEYGVAEALVNRFKERVENCRVDVIDCFSRLLSVTIAMTKSKVCVTAANSQSSRNREIEAVLLILRKTIPSIINSCEKQLSNKKSGERTKSSALSLLSATCQSPFGLGGSEQIASVLRQVQALLKDPDEPKAIKLEALRLVRMILTCPDNSVEDILVMLPSLLPELCRAAQEEWYKITAEALRILAKIPDLILASYNADGVPLLSPESVASSMYAAIENRLKAHDLDQEIKECSLLAAASLVRNFHEYLPQQDREALLCVILERLKNEITRMSALKTLSIIASPTRRAGQTKVDLLCILPDSVRELSSLLRQQSRTLKQHVLETLKILVIGYGVNLSSDSYELILKETGNIISDSDLHVSHLGL